MDWSPWGTYTVVLAKSRHHSEAAVGVGGLRMDLKGATTQKTFHGHAAGPMLSHPSSIPACFCSGLQRAWRPEKRLPVDVHRCCR